MKGVWLRVFGPDLTFYRKGEGSMIFFWWKLDMDRFKKKTTLLQGGGGGTGFLICAQIQGNGALIAGGECRRDVFQSWSGRGTGIL